MGESHPSTSDLAGTDAEDCSICGSRNLENFLRLENMPTLVGAVWHDRDQAMGAVCGDIALLICQDCGYICNTAWRSDLITFAPGYEISLHHSAVYRHFLEKTASELIDRYHLKNKRIVEIGCGPGYFLDLLCCLGENDGFGFDPSLEHDRTDRFENHAVQLVRGYYDSKWSHLQPDLVCCRHAFQSVPNPRSFLESIVSVLGPKADTPCYFEMPNAAYVFDPNIRWDIMFEYLSFFTPDTLATAFDLSGYEVFKSQACYEQGQYLALEARPGKTHASSAVKDRNTVEYLLVEIRAFSRLLDRRLDWWRENLRQYRGDGKKLLGWGAGGRAVTFLCALDVREQIPYVVDINPNRQGAFLPRTGQKIVPPEFVKEYRPDIIVVTNPTYLEEIKTDVAAMGLKCEFVLI
jgi:SAM-dependent methyltransferase